MQAPPSSARSGVALGAVAAALAVVGSFSGCKTSGGGPAPGFSTVYDTAVDGAAPRALRSVRGSGAGSGWTVGEGGVTALLAGGKWYELPSGTTATLGGLSALDVSHAFAVELGGARVLAWNGRVWAPLGADRADRAAAATWAAATNDVWVVGDGIEHWDGQQWTQQVPSGTSFSSVAGSFPTDIWAVGASGVQHYDGRVWAPITVPAGTPALTAVWVTGLYDAWIVGAEGTVLHWNGNAITRIASGTTKNLTSVTGTGGTDMWIGGQDGALLWWNGVTMTELVTPSGRTISDLWRAVTGDQLLLVDDTGAVVSYVR